MRQVLASIAAIGIAGGALGQQSIEDMAPESSFLVVGIDNMAAVQENLRGGLLWEMLQSTEVQELMEGALEQFHDMINMTEQELGLDEGELALPNGAVGVAMFLEHDVELDFEVPGVLFSAHFDGQTEMLRTALDGLVEQADLAGEDFDELTIMGRSVFAFSTGAEEEEPDPDDPFAGAMMGPQMPGFETMYVARSGDLLLGSSNLQVLEGAFEAVDGGTINSVGERGVYNQAREQIEAGDLHAVLLVDGLVEMARSQPGFMMFGDMLGEPLNILGLSEIKAISATVHLAPGTGTMAQHMGILMEGDKRGLAAMFDIDVRDDRAPSFLSDQAISYSRMGFDFGAVMDMVRDVLATMPTEMQQGAEDFMLEYGADLTDLFDSLGSQMHLINNGSIEGPLVVFDVEQSEKLERVVSMFTQQSGMEARDLNGMTVYSHEFAPFAVGLGGSFMAIGSTEQVENALRAGSLNDTGWTGSDGKMRVVHRLASADRVVGWGYTDTAAALDAVTEQMQMQAAMMGGQMPAGMDTMPDLEFLKHYVGPSVWSLRSVDNGFVMTSLMLAPETDR